MNKYRIAFTSSDRGWFSDQDETRMLINRSGVTYDKRKLYMRTSAGDNYYDIECDAETLTVLLLNGGRIVKDLTAEHLEHLKEAAITGLAKLTELEKEALGLQTTSQ